MRWVVGIFTTFIKDVQEKDYGVLTYHYYSDAYFTVVTHARRSTGRLTGAAEGVSRRLLHLANLPAGTDIRRVREQLARMERRLSPRISPI